MATGAGARAARKAGARIRDALPVGSVDGGVRSSAGRIARERLDGLIPTDAYPATPRAAKRADPDYGQPAEPDWRSIDWSRHVHDTEIDGRTVRYVDIGEGGAPPVVFVHGLGGNWQNWLENLPRVAQGRRALALDLPGFGASEMPREDISVLGFSETVEAWLQDLGVGPVVLVGNSMGGFVAAELAIDYPARVERLALVAAAGISVTNLKRRPTMTVARVGVAVGAVTAARRRSIIARERLRHLAMAAVFRHPTRMRSDILYEVLEGSGKPGFHDSLDALTSYDFRDRLPGIDCPTLIVWGREDVLVPVKDADEFERLIPHSRQVVMDDTGHVPMLERPTTFNACLIEFLSEEVPPRRDHDGAPGSEDDEEGTSESAPAGSGESEPAH